MTFLRTLAATLVLLPILALAPAAQEAAPAFPEPLSDTVSDFAAALTATEEGRITRILAEIREKTGVQVVVVTAPGLDGLNGQGMRLEQFGKALFEAWGIGDQERNDGILILVDTGLREARITLGSGYPAVYDDRAARVLAMALLPDLRQGRIAQGVEAGILGARDKLIAPFLAGEPVGPTDGFESEVKSPMPVYTAFAVVFGLFALSAWRRVRARRTCPNCGARSLQRTQEIIAPPTRFQQGLGLQHLTCTACGFIDRRPYPIRYSGAEARRSRDDRSTPTGGESGSRGEGFGGGKSDGGGASGKW